MDHTESLLAVRFQAFQIAIRLVRDSTWCKTRKVKAFEADDQLGIEGAQGCIFVDMNVYAIVSVAPTARMYGKVKNELPVTIYSFPYASHPFTSYGNVLLDE